MEIKAGFPEDIPTPAHLPAGGRVSGGRHGKVMGSAYGGEGAGDPVGGDVSLFPGSQGGDLDGAGGPGQVLEGGV